MTKQEESKITDFCPQHGEILACIHKVLECGHDDYNSDIELRFCPICGSTLQNIDGEKVE